MSADTHHYGAAEIVPLTTDEEWANLLARYPARRNRPLQRCLDVARSAGATCVVVEFDYHDDDYRSEYFAFFSQTFQTVPDSAERLVFFDQLISDDDLSCLPATIECVGYVTIRPQQLGRVGRTVLRPPPDLADAITTAIDDLVHVFGQSFIVTGVPFMQQDTQLGRCAQASAWTCHYSAVRREEAMERRFAADFSLQADTSIAPGRMLPSDGLTVTQLSNLLDEFGLPPIIHLMGEMPSPDRDQPLPVGHDSDAHPGTWDHRAISVACRYLNSGYPVLIGTLDHAFTLCGYARVARADDEKDWIMFVRHDDQRGPYLKVHNILADEDPDTGDIYEPWESMLIPVPRDLWLQPEAAELRARRYIPAFAARMTKDPTTDLILEAARRGDLTYRTYAISQNDYKARLAQRIHEDPKLVRRLRFTGMSRIIWVVEAVDRASRGTGDPSVIAEAIYDSTSADDDPGLLALWGSSAIWSANTSGQTDESDSPGPMVSLANRAP